MGLQTLEKCKFGFFIPSHFQEFFGCAFPSSRRAQIRSGAFDLRPVFPFWRKKSLPLWGKTVLAVFPLLVQKGSGGEPVPSKLPFRCFCDKCSKAEVITSPRRQLCWILVEFVKSKNLTDGPAVFKRRSEQMMQLGWKYHFTVYQKAGLGNI